MARRRWLVVMVGAIVVVLTLVVIAGAIVRDQTRGPDAGEIRLNDESLCQTLAALKPLPTFLGPRSSADDHDTVWRLLDLGEPLDPGLAPDYRVVRSLAKAEIDRAGSHATPSQAASIDHLTHWLRTCP